jgi:Na+-transporting NADH:ubiquinone oxidoreductase subunit F
MIQSIAIGVAALTGVITLLVVLLMLCERKLVRKGSVKLLINDDPSRSPTVPIGSNLLMALSSQNLFLPSACGGKGSCAMCKCQIFEGGGEILPSERTHISRSQAKDGWRLSCQVKVRGPMKIRVPDAVFGIRKWECTVRSNHNVATFIKELVLDLPPGELIDFQSGGYIQIDVPEYQGLKYSSFDVEPQYRPDWDKFKFWDLVANNPAPCFRAYSMANHPAAAWRCGC